MRDGTVSLDDNLLATALLTALTEGDDDEFDRVLGEVCATPAAVIALAAWAATLIGDYVASFGVSRERAMELWSQSLVTHSCA